MSTRKWDTPKQIWAHPNPLFTRIEVFRRWINHKHGKSLRTFQDLHGYSVSDWTFWQDLWDHLGITFSVPPSQIVVDAPQEDSPEWFPGARLNYAENILVRNDNSISCTAAREHGPVRHFSSRELREMVRKMSNAMRHLGLRAGDRVAAIVTNSIDAVVIMLAAASIGAIYSSTATDMGISGILDRYRQIRPKFIFSETDVIYAGKRLDILSKITAISQELAAHGLQTVVLLPSTVDGKDHVLPGTFKSLALSEFLNNGLNLPLVFEQLPFNHPLFILYSSGTSGPPKCIVHTAGGVLLQTRKDYALHMDVHWGDTYFQYTTCAWMMWNAMIANLGLGARIILYDGSPFYPDVKKFLSFISDQDVTHFGTSPRFLSEVQGRNIRILNHGNFESLRVVMVTGAVLTATSYMWTSSQFPKHTHILAGSGGTDICTAFIASNTAMPQYAGEMQVKALGMKVEVFDPKGVNIEDTGEPGELVCTRAHPSLPVGFWGDDERIKYHDAYYSSYPHVWAQGDFMVVNPVTKGIYILGRSDGVLNPSGVRFGSGEIYTVMEKYTNIMDDCICVGQRRPQDVDERVILFLKMREGHKCTDALKDDIRSSIKSALSTRHIPSYIFQVDEIPYTVNNKKIEIAVKQIISGSKIKPSGTVANPESLAAYYKYVELEKLVGTAKAKL